MGKNSKMLSTWTTRTRYPYSTTSPSLASLRLLQTHELILCDYDKLRKIKSKESKTARVQKVDIGSSVASREELGFYDCPGPPPKLLALFGYCMLELKEALCLTGLLAEEHQVPGLLLD